MTIENHGIKNLAETIYDILDEDGDKADGNWVCAYRKGKGKHFPELGIYKGTSEELVLRGFDCCIRITRAPGNYMHEIFTELFNVDLCDPELYTNRDGRVEEHILGEGEFFVDNKDRLITQIEMFLSWSLKNFA